MISRAIFKPVYRVIALLMLSGLVCQLSVAPAAEYGSPPGVPDVQGKEAGVSLDQLLRHMLASNPELQAARKRWGAMQKRPGQESALRAQQATVDSRRLGLDLSRREYYPDFEVMGGYFNQGSMKDMGEIRVQMKSRTQLLQAMATLSELVGERAGV